jgi:tetratricopeptide (TPR) repeat protein
VAIAFLLAAGCSRNHGDTHGSAAGEMVGPTTRDGRLSPLLANLGSFSRKVSTAEPDAQTYFNQGLALIYGFNHAEAERSFREAARIDPKLGIAHWGVALAVGPNINDPAPNEERDEKAREAVGQALALRQQASPVEQALIDAIAKRYPADGSGGDLSARNAAYAEQMEEAYRRFPKDPDVATLYAASVMDTMPWYYWEKDGSPRNGTLKVLAALEAVMRDQVNHPGANHYYIHAVEASRDPDRGIPAADRLGGLMPGAGHLIHMPAHIYIRVGRYSDATDANIRAIAADEDYITQCRAQGIYPAAYYPHNIHFLTASLAMEGRSKEMIEASQKVGHHHEDAWLKEPGFGFAHLLRVFPTFSLVRFGKWDGVMTLPMPPDSEKFGRATWHFARGMALSARADSAGAATELAALREYAKDPDVDALKIMDLNSLGSLVDIATHMLAGEIAYRKGNYDQAVRELKAAIEIDDNLLYSEPPDWPLPPRHYLGAILLDAKRPAEAERVYREDLNRHRGNGWSLHGLAEALDAQGRRQEAEDTRVEFQKMWQKADVQLRASRF